MVGKKWLENDSWEKLPDYSADSGVSKFFAEMALFRTVSEINAFCVLCRNLRWLAKMAGKRFMGKVTR